MKGFLFNSLIVVLLAGAAGVMVLRLVQVKGGAGRPDDGKV